MRSGCLTRAFSGAQKREEMLHHPCIPRGPERQARVARSQMLSKKGQKNKKWLPHPCLLRGPKEGGNATPPLHSRGSPTPSAGREIRKGPNKGEVNQKWLPHPCLVGGPKEGGNATSPLHSRGIPNAKRGEGNQKRSTTKVNKIRSGCLTLPSPGPQKRAAMLRHPCIPGGP